MPKELTIKTTRGEIAATLFGSAGPGVLIGPAMGVPRRFYQRFANYLAESGMTVLTFDYEGIGESKTSPLRQSTADLVSWSEDTRAAATKLQSLVSGPIYFVGHSVGGQLIGMTELKVKKALLVASQSGYWKHWPGLWKYGLWTYWSVLPPISKLCGKFPNKLLQQGEDLPPGVAAQWAKFGKKERYIGSSANPLADKLSKFQTDVVAIAISDDRFAPRAAVAGLLELLPQCSSQIWDVVPQDFDKETLGHFGLFRPNEAAWREMKRRLTN